MIMNFMKVVSYKDRIEPQRDGWLISKIARYFCGAQQFKKFMLLMFTVPRSNAVGSIQCILDTDSHFSIFWRV